MLAGFRESFDVMTLYKPVRIVAEEKKGIVQAFGLALGFFVSFVVLCAVLSFAVSPGNFQQFFLGHLYSGFFVFLVMLLHVPFSTFASFLASRAFGSKGDFLSALSINWFLSASALPFLLVFFIPLAEFAGIILLFLGLALYLYFVNEACEYSYQLSTAKSMGLTFAYAICFAATIIVSYLIFSLAGIKPF